MTRKTNDVRFVPRGIIPTKEQCDIQLSQRRVSLIEANAGAAKTTTLALRVGEALARGMAPEQILTLVFTPEAAAVMSNRLVEIGVHRDIAARLKVHTFEDFAAEFLASIENDEPRRLVQAEDLKEYAVAALAEVSERYVGKVDFLDVRMHNVAISQFLDLQLHLKATMALQALDDELSLEEQAWQSGVPVTEFLWTLEYEHLRHGGFGDPVFRGPFDATYDLARYIADRQVHSSMLPKYRLILVDELHDLNEATFRILRALLSSGEGYFVGAGDKDQVIHSMLGANSSFLSHRVLALHSSSQSFPLRNTYRHGPYLAMAMSAFKNKPITSSVPFMTEITQLQYDFPEACGACVVEIIQRWCPSGRSHDGCAILLRGEHQSIAIENALMHAGIAYRTVGIRSYLEREEILFLRGMVAIALNNFGTVKSPVVRSAIIDALAMFAELDLTDEDMVHARTSISQSPETLHWFFSGQIQRCSSELTRSRISEAVAYMREVSGTTLASEVLEKACALMKVSDVAKRLYVDPYKASGVSKSLNGFIRVAHQSGMNLQQFSEWIGSLDSEISKKRVRNAVWLGSVSNAKGNEFDNVILPFLEEGEFPASVRELGEEENLFYVGATRTKKNLCLMVPSDESKRSRFVRQMELLSSRAEAMEFLRENPPTQSRLPQRIILNVPYVERDLAKALGAKWDPTLKVWYIASVADTRPFAQWLHGSRAN